MFCNKLKLGNIKKKLMIGLFGFKYSYWLIMENKIWFCFVYLIKNKGMLLNRIIF